MGRKKVFVSFDYENDRHYKRLLEAWSANSKFDFVFADKSAREINSENIARIKAGLTDRIKLATYTLVIVGKYANSKHPKSKLIGSRNWINWEIKKSKELGNKLVGVKIDKSFESPDELLNSNASWAFSFTESAIIKALENA